MSLPDELSTILDRLIANQQHTKADRDRLWELLDGGRQLVQSGKYAINLGQGQDIHIGDRRSIDALAIAADGRDCITGSQVGNIKVWRKY